MPVLGKGSVSVFQIIISPERAKNSHIHREALHDGKNGGRVLVPSSVRLLEAGGAVHEHDNIPLTPQ